ncbi:MAG: DUF6755 family protein [Candidatus Binatia bacterium]
MTVLNPQSAIHHRQRDTTLSLVLAFVIVLLLVQLWLLVEAVEGDASGAGAIAVPATLASGLCFLGAWGLWRLQ